MTPSGRRVPGISVNDAGMVGSYALLTVLALVVIFPLYMTVVNSLLTPSQISARPPQFFPFHPQWDSYSQAWNGGHMSQFL